jgi:hypothetical protein
MIANFAMKSAAPKIVLISSASSDRTARNGGAALLVDSLCLIPKHGRNCEL